MDFEDKVMESMKAKLVMSKEEVEAFLNNPDCATTGVRGLVKLLSETLNLCIQNAITKITKKGYTEEAAEHAILRCGPFTPFHCSEGNLESNIVEGALLSLQSNNKKYNDSADYTFQELNELVDFTVLEMVTTLRDIKPSLSVSEAIWCLLMCDLNVSKASVMERDLQQMGTSAEPETESGSKSEPKNQETIASNVKRPPPQSSKSGKKTVDICTCRNWCAMATHKRDATLRGKAALLLEKPYKGRRIRKGLKKQVFSLKELSLINKQSPSSSSSSSSSSSEQNKNTSLPLKETEEKPKGTPKSEQPKTIDYYLKNIPCDENGEYVPRDDKDILRLEAVAQIEALQKELQGWDDWATSKVMEVTKRLNQHRSEVNTLKAEMKDNEAMDENTAKRLLETTLTLNTTNSELNVANSTIVKLQTEQSVIKEESERERNRSIFEAKRLEQALIKEEEARKKSQSTFGSEKTSLEEELKVLKRQVGQKQQELEKAKCLLSEALIRVAKEERETAKVVNKAECIKNERERIEALAMAEYEIMKGKAEEEFKKNETENKRIEYEISAFKLEAESKRIAEMYMSMNMNMDSSKGLEDFRNMSKKRKKKKKKMMKKKKKKDRECVMCLNEEMTVVFVPCGHQVLCKACNVKHEERMNECPSCRTPIQKRINARFAKS
ncbi:unnamed protein product [Lactuca virosa]|uniref:RING-type domain-containing protein n=1 Tax=Lactuca virosa TaxID=75947 RepID=A0AAU9N122_9ASTR|nr:unnamed protein product [Lactuca virosa]